ncbi:hypothetical protein [Enterococcus timonensis]|uniref:hypothetical protein n=1 Tax=Enterococcus timonensis TaxID=1852364 RepID=UPI0008D9FB43|nr:hypothetical protein [Enterococcus timonensis]
MTKIKISILNQDSQVKQGKNDYEEFSREMSSEMDNQCYLSTQDLSLEDGDQIIVELDEKNQFLVVKLDETLDSTMIFVPEKRFTYHVQLSENARNAQSDLKFTGKRHYFSARLAYDFEISNYQNLSQNTHDQKDFAGAYPHAHANVETRNDATFFAANAIDGIQATHSHGEYPYQSWGINQQADAALTIDFGRRVLVNRVGLTLRADFPHDSFWEEVTIVFSDGSAEKFQTKKSDQMQFFDFSNHQVTSITLQNLKKAQDESPFPALTELALFGSNILK